MSRFVRPSKYRHVYPNVAKKEHCYENVKVSNNAWDTNLVAANGKYISINWNASGGGAFAVLPINRPGKLPDIYPLCRGHTATVLDTAFSPFQDNFVASASDDGTIGLWNIDGPNFDQLEWSDKERERNGGVKDFEPIARVSGGGRKIGQVVWHPTASNVLAAATGDHVVKLFDVSSASTAASSPSISLRGFTDTIQSLDWDWTGSTLIATSRDRKIRTFDPRTGESPVQVADSHGGIKGARVIWCGDKDRAITTGFSKMSDRQMFLWDTKNLSSGPLKQVTLDSSSGIIMPFWSDNNIVFLAGKGDGNIRYYELENDELHYLTESKSSEPQRGLTFVGRRFLNTDENEIAKAYKITGTTIQPVSFCVPRKAEGFQSDIFPPAPSAEPALTANQFFDGKRAPRNLISLETGRGVGSNASPPPAAAAASAASSTQSAPASTPAAAPAPAPAPAQTQALPRAASPTKPSPIATPFAEEPKPAPVKDTPAPTSIISARVATSASNGLPPPSRATSNNNDNNNINSEEVEQLKKELEKLRTAVEQRDTKIRHLEQENETLKTNQKKAREAILSAL
ncbi:probable CRN1 - a coronin, that promotes actin polymerization and crosslinking to microtubules [Melanopsichium pennsylvanicum]|uniref:Coronin n=2 Tax=Melanopsichium pennsylvanicum TaxID=63383 RepID=A0AAJ4XL78_9BASI|nr:probable CRN1-a coronin, that promotes actin polymerization and crosslinking to microtubules [Melanopsichium pennsylvanicum 4]SNX84006.1 probable CRN1 - a coronin, that promotes actin polymerization and crosslinking to microtubules [Melanopsichium pennsylvanicum]